MSNYNNQLQSNNNELQDIINTINNLPTQGSGSGDGDTEVKKVQFINSTASCWLHVNGYECAPACPVDVPYFEDAYTTFCLFGNIDSPIFWKNMSQRIPVISTLHDDNTLYGVIDNVDFTESDIIYVTDDI